jgi:hypothetical protein
MLTPHFAVRHFVSRGSPSRGAARLPR